MLNLLSRFARNDSGAAAVEYGILVAFIAAGIIVAVASIGGYIASAFQSVCSALAENTSLTTTVACPGGTTPTP